VKRSLVAPALMAVLVLGGVAAAVAADSIPAYVASAVADATRPAGDRARDADRKPAEVLAFAGVKPGQKVGELFPGGGYYTRLLSAVVGPSGKVFALWPEGLAKMRPQMIDASKSIAPNVTAVLYTPGALPVPEKLDVVWTTENYHDFHNAPPGAPAPDMMAFNKAVYDALKPGGVYLIEDHAGAAGTGTTQTNTLHRIDPAAVKSEVEAAGFRLVAQSDALANRNDPHTAGVRDQSIQGHTDKLLFRFVRP
jgi:predicted methyltransferase